MLVKKDKLEKERQDFMDNVIKGKDLFDRYTFWKERPVGWEDVYGNKRSGWEDIYDDQPFDILPAPNTRKLIPDPMDELRKRVRSNSTDLNIAKLEGRVETLEKLLFELIETIRLLKMENPSRRPI